MTTRLKSLTDTLKMVRWQGKHKIVGDDRAIARALLAELGVNGAERVAKPQRREVKTREQFTRLGGRTVLLDDEERVLELWPEGWKITGEDGVYDGPIDLPALVLWTPEPPA